MPTNDQAMVAVVVEQRKDDEHISTIEDQASKDSSRPSVVKDVHTKVSTEVPHYVPPHRYAPFPSRLPKDNDKTEK
jgi:hypothetical protein